MGPRLKLPPYVHAFTDRHGKSRYYLRRPGFKRIPLPGLPWSPEFMAAHSGGMAGDIAGGQLAPGENRTRPGTISALIVAYFNSAQFKSLSRSTQTTYRGIVERFRIDHGDKRVALLERDHIAKMLRQKVGTPAAANNWLRMVRMLMQFAVTEGMRRDDPTLGVKGIKSKSEGFHTWTEDEICAFEAHHAIGTRARLALALLLFTAQRRGDVVRMGRQHIRNGVLSIRQQKTGTLVEIPVHVELAKIIEATPAENLTFLVTEYGKPFSPAGFGNLFRDWCRSAGLLEHCSAHGLRKAASRRLAEAGCTAHEIMAITGHLTLKEVTRYTAAVDRKRLAVTAMQKTATRTSVGKPE